MTVPLEPTPTPRTLYVRNLLSTCSSCDTPLVIERWTRERVVSGGPYVRQVYEAPHWAASYVLRGVAVVNRYRCPGCGRVAAILAGDR